MTAPTTPALDRKAQCKALLDAFRFIDSQAAIMNGAPEGDTPDPDDIAPDLAAAFGVEFDEDWPKGVLAALTQASAAKVPEGAK